MKLEGVRVIDLSQFLPGPMLTLVMADDGAEVIKVEPPGGEHGRRIGAADGPAVRERNGSPGWTSLRQTGES